MLCSSLARFTALTLLWAMSVYLLLWPWCAPTYFELYRLYKEAGTSATTVIGFWTWCHLPREYETISSWSFIATETYWNQSNAHRGQNANTLHYSLGLSEKEGPIVMYFQIRDAVKDKKGLKVPAVHADAQQRKPNMTNPRDLHRSSYVNKLKLLIVVTLPPQSFYRDKGSITANKLFSSHCTNRWGRTESSSCVSSTTLIYPSLYPTLARSSSESVCTTLSDGNIIRLTFQKTFTRVWESLANSSKKAVKKEMTPPKTILRQWPTRFYRHGHLGTTSEHTKPQIPGTGH